MAYTIDDLAWIIKKLSEAGFKTVIIGSTVVDLELRRTRFEEDLDLFALEPSPLVEEEAYMELARTEGWTTAQTALGTPKFILRVPSGEEVIVEFYENIHDFFIPPEILNEAPTKRIKGVPVRTLRVEDYVVLKAKAGREVDLEDLRIVKEYVDEGRLKLDERVLKADIQRLPEEDQPLVIRRLKDLGFRV